METCMKQRMYKLREPRIDNIQLACSCLRNWLHQPWADTAQTPEVILWKAWPVSRAAVSRNAAALLLALFSISLSQSMVLRARQ